jgi:uncharacterized membrane protein YhhN
MPGIWFFVLLSGVAVLNWVGNARQSKVLVWVTKPTYILLLLGWVFTTLPFNSVTILFLLGLGCSLVGDVLLMLPQRPFLAAMGAFFLTHLLYGLGLSMPLSAQIFLSLGMTLAVLASEFSLLKRFQRALTESGQTRYRLPLLAYGVALSFSLGAALATFGHPAWETFSSILVSGGGALFFFSDVLIARHRFLTPVPHRDLMVMVSYQAGQFALILGMVSHTL